MSGVVGWRDVAGCRCAGVMNSALTDVIRVSHTPASQSHQQLEKYVSPVPTCYAAVRLELHNSDLDLMNRKLAHWLLLPRRTFTPTLAFLRFLFLS